VGYKVNIQKSVVLVHTNNKLIRSQETIPFTITSKKYLGIILSKKVNDFYNENLKHWEKKEIGEDIGQDWARSWWVGRRLEKTLEDEKTSHVHGSAELIL
jgi:hypothetical protein